MKNKIKELVDNHLENIKDMLPSWNEHLHEGMDELSEKLIEDLGDVFETNFSVDTSVISEQIIMPNIEAERILSSKHLEKSSITDISSPVYHALLESYNELYPDVIRVGFRYDPDGIPQMIVNSLEWEKYDTHPWKDRVKGLDFVHQYLHSRVGNNFIIWIRFDLKRIDIKLNRFISIQD